MIRLLPPNLWLPIEQTPGDAICAQCRFAVWWREDLEEATMPGTRLWIGSRFGLRIRPLGFVHQPGHA
jgi:hypothetical protein